MVDIKKLKELLKDEPSYRLRQAEKAIYKDFVSDWSIVTTLPLRLRDKLQDELTLGIPGKFFPSGKEDAVKALITLDDGFSVETVLMRYKDNRNTVCVSSQIGCQLDCLFCRTGKLGFKRNLTSEEIIDQVLFFSRYLKGRDNFITNIVFMGMGEPFLNYENVIGAIRILNDKNKFNIGARRISISTSGIPDKIKMLAKEELQINLAVSLNAPDDEIRSRLMSVNKIYPIKGVLDSVKFYTEKTRRRVMFEYLMINNLNDCMSHAKELSKLIKGILCFVNLIPYNRDPDCKNNDLKPSTKERISEFKEILRTSGITVTERFRFGRDVRAACGQLAYEKKL